MSIEIIQQFQYPKNQENKTVISHEVVEWIISAKEDVFKVSPPFAENSKRGERKKAQEHKRNAVLALLRLFLLCDVKKTHSRVYCAALKAKLFLIIADLRNIVDYTGLSMRLPPKTAKPKPV